MKRNELVSSTVVYSKNSDLAVFLRTLSYHRLGAGIFADVIAGGFSAPTSWTCIDVGCGDGFFSSMLLRELGVRNCIPASIHGMDPDIDNLRGYLDALRAFPNRLSAERGIVQFLPVLSADVVICSHSLYHALEDPTASEQEKDDYLFDLLRSVNPEGLLLISMASHRSLAYRVKAEVCGSLGVVDRSVLGEDLAARLDRLDIAYQVDIRDSYADMTEVIRSPDALSSWLRYFCRLTPEQLNSENVAQLSEKVHARLRSMSELQPSERDRFYEYPADIPLREESKILPHAECFLVINKPR